MAKKLRVTLLSHENTITESLYVDGELFAEDINEEILRTILGKLHDLGYIDFKEMEYMEEGDCLIDPLDL